MMPDDKTTREQAAAPAAKAPTTFDKPDLAHFTAPYPELEYFRATATDPARPTRSDAGLLMTTRGPVPFGPLPDGDMDESDKRFLALDAIFYDYPVHEFTNDRDLYRYMRTMAADRRFHHASRLMALTLLLDANGEMWR